MKNFFKKIIVSLLTSEAKAALRKYKPRVVAITGSVGKTSAKDAVHAALTSAYSARKSEKNFNTELGILLTVLGLRNARSNPFLWAVNAVEGFLLIVFPFSYPEWLVLEVGTRKPGDIAEITKWLRPDIVIVTRLGETPAHIEFFPTIEDLIDEKGTLARAMKDDGVFIYNRDDPRVVKLAESIIDKKISYGFDVGADIEASEEEIVYMPFENSELEFPEGMSFVVNYGGSGMKTRVNGGLGRQHIYPLLAAFAVGISAGIPPATLSRAFTRHNPPKGRMRLIAGEKDTVIIDDTYNSSPDAVQAALHTLEDLKCAGRKIAALGDMLELGSYSVEEHKKAGERAAGVASILVTVGVRARGMADAALDAGMDENNILQFDTSSEAGKFLESVIGRGDLILVKGSQAMRMERVVEEIMAHPESKEIFLVRQDRFWVAQK